MSTSTNTGKTCLNSVVSVEGRTQMHVTGKGTQHYIQNHVHGNNPSGSGRHVSLSNSHIKYYHWSDGAGRMEYVDDVICGTSPDWWCLPQEVPDSEVTALFLNNKTSELCLPKHSNSSSCRYVYSDDKSTVVSEWSLVCAESKTPAFMTSIQMGGVLVGAFLGGQSSDMLGRKPTFFLSVLLEGGLNLAAAFSISWEMFAVFRFFIGMTIGSLLAVSYPYCLEFVSPKWRAICGAAPYWYVGVSIMALSAWLRPNWSHQHIILAAVHIPLLLCWFIAPESIRWLAVKGRLDEAEKVVDQMCRYNKREKPSNTRMLLEKIAEEEQRCRESGKKYTYLDIYRGWSLCWKSLIVQFVWMCMALVYYGISFGAGELSGNLYLNIFLLSLVGFPAGVASFFFNNKIGRRWTSFFFLMMAVSGSIGVIITTRLASGDYKGTVITVLALVTQGGVGGAWAAFQLLSTEIYPTVIRNLGYGAVNTSARVGGMIAPYIFATDGKDVMIPFIIVGSAMGICAILSLVMPETRGIPLEDSIQSKDVEKNQQLHMDTTDFYLTHL